MEDTILVKKKVRLRNPVLVEGLPGIGLVGKLAADHMIEELEAEKIAELYSAHFPHQVLMLKKGMMRMLKNKFYAVRGKKRDVVVLVGDVQAVTPESQFQVCGKILDYFGGLGGKRIYTLGGYGVGKVVEKPRVFGSATHMKTVKELQPYGIIFGEARGSIIGAAGLLLGLGKLRGMDGACLMGETHGGYVDAKSAQAVLEVLGKVLDVKMDLKKLETRAKESEKFMKRVQKEAVKQKQVQEGALSGRELTYIR
jgi:uncharacterized protein (TIGR00162 family)